MKRLVFIASNRVHLARQSLLLKELRKYFEIDVFEPKQQENGMSINAIFYAIEFSNFLNDKQYDGVLARGDRYEILPMVVVAAYKGIKIIHIEGGDLSGAIDNKVRHAVTHLSDFHFCTNDESHERLIKMGVSVDKVWNYGSLDVEFADTVELTRHYSEPYLFVAFHPIEGEDESEVKLAVSKFPQYKIINIASNKDYGREYGKETYTPEEYVNLMRYALCLIGNSSSLLKEASILGVPVVNVGNRQIKRLKPKNVLDVPCESEKIKLAIDFQLNNTYEPDYIYYKVGTSKNMAEKIKEIL